MKQGWEIKKLGDICCKKQQIARALKTYSPSDSIVYIDISAIDSSTNEITEPTTILLQDAPSRAQQVVEKNDILVSLVRPNLKNIALICDDRNNLVASSGFCILRTKENPRFLKYIVLGEPFTNYLISRTSGANYPAVREDDVKGYSIPIPPLSEQEKIVAELDCLSGIIEKKKQQLKEYDALAQSIFYEMFGNPIDNEKGWEVKKLGEEFEISSGGTPNTKNTLYWVDGDISWIGSNMCHNDIIYQNDGKYITNEGLEHSSAKMYQDGYVIVALVGATIGKTALLKFPTTTNQNVAGINVPSNRNYTSEYVFYLIQNLYGLFQSIGNGKFKMANLSFIRSLPLIVPPLTLQQEFASKIEAIEKQKELIKQSIAETETLFNSRMDFYFG